MSNLQAAAYCEGFDAGKAEAAEEIADEIEQLRKDTVLLMSGLAWAVGALEGTGHGEGHAKNTLEQFLERATGSNSETTEPIP